MILTDFLASNSYIITNKVLIQIVGLEAKLWTKRISTWIFWPVLLQLKLTYSKKYAKILL